MCRPSISMWRGLRLLPLTSADFAIPGETIDHIEQRQQDAAYEQHRQQHGFQRPEKVDALEEAEKQRRVSERRERAADVGDQEDEEHEDVDVVAAVLVRPDDRSNQHHGGAGRAEKACRQGAEGEHRRVRGRRADEIAADADAAGNNEQREQQDDEGQIVEQEHMQDLGRGRPKSARCGQGNDQGKRPEGGHLAEMTLPGMRRDQRQHGDGEKQTGERHRPRQACAGAVEMHRNGRRDAAFGQGHLPG